MPNTKLLGRSILVVAEQPFSAHCLQVLLEGAGAEVYGATCASEALHFMERQRLSAAVLDGITAKSPRRVAQRLVRLGIPFVLCKADVGEDEPLSGVPVLIKPVLGVELIDTLCLMINAHGQGTPVATGRARRRLPGEPAGLADTRSAETST